MGNGCSSSTASHRPNSSCQQPKRIEVKPTTPPTTTSSFQSTTVTMSDAGTSTLPRASQSALDPFMQCLRDPDGYQLIRNHVALGFSEHHLDFWTAVQAYKECCLNSGVATVQYHAKQIYTNYIRSSDTQVNLTEPVRLYITENVESTDLKKLLHLYDAAEQTAIELVRGNYWYTIEHCDEYQQWLAHRDDDVVVLPGGRRVSQSVNAHNLKSHHSPHQQPQQRHCLIS